MDNDIDAIIRHYNSVVTQEVLAAKQRIRDKVEPRVRDALLYLCRDEPNVKQVERLLLEIRDAIEL